MLPVLLAVLSLSAGNAAPPLDSLELLQTPAGAKIAWQVPRNTPLVVEFWATWCAPCVEQIPHWNSLVAKFSGRAQFIAISAEDPETVTEFLKKRPMAGWVALDLDGMAHRVYGVETVPRTFLVDAGSVVCSVTTLSALRDTDLEALVAGRTFRPTQQAGSG